MSDWMRQILESKRAMRSRLASLPIAEKLALLEKLRGRSLAIRAARLARLTKPALKTP
ncbi:MAG: hypothetical protein ABSC03_16750 [Verrucomicrobiota bacterium]|jgi:hypothetical protein